MRTLEQRLSYEKLELIPQKRLQRKNSVFLHINSFITRIGKSLFNALTVSAEPHIWTRDTPNGHTIWYVREPQNQQVIKFNSEDEVRVWLDNNYSNARVC